MLTLTRRCALAALVVLTSIARGDETVGAAAAPVGRSYHVAPSGDDDSADPTNPSTPLRTLQKAADLVAEGDEVLIHTGVYRETVVVRDKHGTPQRPIVLKAHPGDRPVVSGADLVTGPWAAVEGRPHVYRASLKTTFRSAMNQTEQLFVDGQMLHLARFPDATVGELFEPDRMMKITEVVAAKTLKPGAPTPWGEVKPRGAMEATIKIAGVTQPDGYWDGAILYVIPRDDNGMGWGFGCVGPVLEHKGGALRVNLYFTTGDDGSGPLIDLTAGDPAYLFNCAAALDAPGEWHHDERNGTIDVWLPDGSSPEDHVVEVKRRDWAFDLSESSHVTLQGLRVFAASITTDHLFGKAEGGGEWAGGGRGAGNPQSTGNAPAHHVRLDRLWCRYINHFWGTWGNAHGQWIQASGITLAGEDHVLENSAIEYSAGNGVVLYGSRHKVLNNIIHDVDYTAAHCSGVYLQQTGWDPTGDQVFPMDCEVAHNTIYRAGWGGIDASKMYSSDPASPASVAWNFIDGVGLLTQDVGGIRFVGRPDDVPGDPSRREPPINSTRVHHNWVRSVVAPLGNAIYFDFCEGYVADHNLVTDSESFICVNQSGMMEVSNNTGWRVRRGLGGLVSGNPDRLNLRELKVRNNALDSDIQKPSEQSDPSYNPTSNAEWVLATEFKGPEEGDFTPASGSKLVDGGEETPWTQGRQGSAPDIGAFEQGEDDWMGLVGADWGLVAAPSDLEGAATADGRVQLRWKDRSNNEKAFVVEVAGPTAGHPRPGWEYVVLGRTKPDVTTLSAVLTRPVREYTFRVRTDRSHYSSTLYLRCGQATPTIDFGSEQGYLPGSLLDQKMWVGVHGGRGIDQSQPEFAQVVEVSGKQRLELRSSGDRPDDNPASFAALGDLRLIDNKFRSGASRVRFTARIGLKSIDPQDHDPAAEIHLGGVGYWQTTYPPLATISIHRDGQVRFGPITAGTLEEKAGSKGRSSLATVSGVLNLASGQIEDVRWNRSAVPGEGQLPSTNERGLETALWQIASHVRDAKEAVVIEQLGVSVED